MTKSPLVSSHPKLVKKEFRANAKGLKFVKARELRAKEGEAAKFLHPQAVHRRNEGRGDGRTWNGKGFICPKQVEDQLNTCDYYCECWYDFEWAKELEYEAYCYDEEIVTEKPKIDSLLDIAKPEKVKGVRKEFEVVDRLLQVIALQDNEDACSSVDWDTQSEAWESMYESDGEVSQADDCKKSYAAVLLEDREK